MSEKKRVSGTVSGRVQGVGFRYFVQKKAQSLKLVGEVKNRGDGGVEFTAEGPEDALHTLLKHIERGPTLSHVTSVNTRWSEPLGTESGFHITY